MKRYLTILLAITLISISALIFDVKSTSAVSDYDNVYQSVGELYLRSSYKNINENVSVDWNKLILNDDGLGTGITPQWAGSYVTSPQQIADLRQSFTDTIADPDGGWTVSQTTLPNGDEGIFISWSQQSGFQLEWLVSGPKTSYNTDYNVLIAPWDGMNGRYAIYATTGGCSPVSGTSHGCFWSSSEGTVKSFIANLNPNYPEGYEGELLQTSYTPDDPPIAEVPDFYIVQGVDHKIEIADNRYFTFDEPNRTLCQPHDLTPLIVYELSTIDNVLVDSGVFSPTLPYSYQWPDKNSEGTYIFTGSYSCIDSPPEFTGSTTVTFSMSKDGIYTDNFMATCFIDEPPYVDIDGCISGMSRAFNLLGFKTLKFGNDVWLTFQPQCGQLSVLGHWIHKPNQVICPIFPAYVRDTVTPFITFALGLLMLNFVTKHGGTGF